jgi:hypothetical protein
MGCSQVGLTRIDVRFVNCLLTNVIFPRGIPKNPNYTDCLYR